MSKGTILKVSGPLVVAENMRDANMFDVVRVSEHRLIGEIIEMHGGSITVESELSKFTRFTLKLPVSSKDKREV